MVSALLGSITTPDHGVTPSTTTAVAQVELRLETYVNKILQSRLRKRKRQRSDDDDDDIESEDRATKEFIDYGRSFVRLGEPFTNVFNIVEHGLVVVRDADSEEEDELAETSTTDDSRRLSASWDILCNIIPGFKHDMVALAEKRKIRKIICNEIMTGVDRARADDSSTLKGPVLSYIHLDTSVPLHPPIPPLNTHKSLRGWNHPATATLLTPMGWDADPTVWADVLCGRKKVTAQLFPRLLYPEGHVYNPYDMEDGLLRNHILVRNAKHIFMGPASALRGPGYKKGRASVSKIIGMSRITPRALAYTIVQSRFSISDAQEWHTVDRDFNYRDFFWSLVELLEADEGKAILEYFNHEIFGAAETDETDTAAVGQAQGASSFNRLKEQRAAKQAVAAQAALAAAQAALAASA